VIVQAVNNQVSELKILEKGLKSALPGWRDELKIMDARSRELRDEVSKLREKIVKLESEEKGLRESITTREKEMELVEKAVEKLFTEMSAEISTVKKKVEEYTVEASVPPPPTRSSPSKSTIAAKGKGALTKKSEDAKPEPEPEQEESGWQKKCPMCGGRMDLFSQDNMWRCYSCGNEEADNGRSSAQESVSTPTEPEEDTEWKKKCPMCGGKMNYYSQENLWQCYTCAYEEGEKSGGTDSSAKRNSPGPYAVPLGDISFDAFGETETKSPSYSKQSATKKKPCPACRKKMSWYPDEQAWRCPYCHYERRI
jgi:rubrerythrin